MAREKPYGFVDSATLESSPRLEVSGGPSSFHPGFEDQPRVNGLPMDRGQKCTAGQGGTQMSVENSMTGRGSARSTTSRNSAGTNKSSSTVKLQLAKTLSTVAAGHGKAGGTAIKTVSESGKPTTILKVLDDTELQVYQHLAKLKHDPISPHVAQFVGVVDIPGDNRKYIRIRNLLQDFTHPKVMDVKLGLRTFQESECSNNKPRPDLYDRMCELYPDELKSEEHAKKAITKFRWMTTRDRQSTIGTLGYRIDGVAGLTLAHIKDDLDARIPKMKTMDDSCHDYEIHRG